MARRTKLAGKPALRHGPIQGPRAGDAKIGERRHIYRLPEVVMSGSFRQTGGLETRAERPIRTELPALALIGLS